MKRQQLTVNGIGNNRIGNNPFQGRNVLVEKQPKSSEDLRGKMKGLLRKANMDLNEVYTRLTSDTRKNALHEEFEKFLRMLNGHKNPYNEIINELGKYRSKNNNSGLTKFYVPFEGLTVVVPVNTQVVKNQGKNVGQKGKDRDARTLEVAGFILYLKGELKL